MGDLKDPVKVKLVEEEKKEDEMHAKGIPYCREQEIDAIVKAGRYQNANKNMILLKQNRDLQVESKKDSHEQYNKTV